MQRLLALALVSLAGCAAASSSPRSRPAQLTVALAPDEVDELRRQVWEREQAFAATMAARDHEAFSAFLSEHALFISGSQVLRGKAAVAEAWAPLFEGSEAPFAWEPDMVEVLGDGTLALSTGPIVGPDGELAGRFNSIWRREAQGWRIVFDRGS